MKRFNPRIKLLLLITALFVIAASAFGGYSFRHKQVAKDEVPTIIVDGKEYKAVYTKTKGLNEPPVVQTDYASEAANLEEQYASKKPTTDEYLVLAQLYLQAGNKNKAIENYEKAKAALDKKASDYQTHIDSLNTIISNLKSQQ